MSIDKTTKNITLEELSDDVMEENGELYVIMEGEKEIKVPTQPAPENYYDILESEEDRAERIYLYSEVY